jgi:hypothetical protein
MYPIRFSKEKWRIRVSPPVQITKILLSEFGQTENLDEVVIKLGSSQELTVHVRFPLSLNVSFHRTMESREISRRTLLSLIAELYEEIYQVEEVTAPVYTYTALQRCDVCLDKPLDASLVQNAKPEKCSICLEEGTDTQLIKCSHTFHGECIRTWLADNVSCPLCRESVHVCENCNGTQVLVNEFTASVLPLEHRLDGYRNDTDGLFGIYRYDLDDLWIDDLFYNRLTQSLELSLHAELNR